VRLGKMFTGGCSGHSGTLSELLHHCRQVTTNLRAPIASATVEDLLVTAAVGQNTTPKRPPNLLRVPISTDASACGTLGRSTAPKVPGSTNRKFIVYRVENHENMPSYDVLV
jgi:hypothetical protein